MKQQKDRLYVVSYDFSEDKERTKAANILGAFGFRVQYSVFECRLTKTDLNKMLKSLDKVKFKSGHIRIYQVYSNSLIICGICDEKSSDSDTAFVV